MSSSSERALHLSAFGTVVASNLNLQARYSTSAAFDRPVHASVATLVLTSLVFFGIAKTLGYHSPGSGPRPLHEPPALLDRLRKRFHAAARTRAYSRLLVPLAIVARVLLYWRTTRTIQCSWDGLYAFLPFFTAICDHPFVRPIYLPRHAADESADSSPRTPTPSPSYRFAALALIWAYAVTDLSAQPSATTSVICPGGWQIERFIPLAQLSAVFLDAVIITQAARVRHTNSDQPGSAWHRLGNWLWTSAALLGFLAVWSVLDEAYSTTNIVLTALEARDVAVDSILATFSLVFAVGLLGSFQANLVSLVVTSPTILVLILSHSFAGAPNVPWFGFHGFATGLVVFLGFATLFHLCLTSLPFGMSFRREHAFAMGHYCLYALVAYLLVLSPAYFVRPQGDYDVSPKQAMAAGRVDSAAWLADANRSVSFRTAVDEYWRRYGIPPPPKFDKWYEFALSVNSSVIDSFDQIDSDLLPFWAIPPALLRAKTTHLLEHPSLSMGGLLIQGGKTSISPHIHGTHRWMVDVAEEMITSFSQWLPDMQLAFNLDDECRIAPPATDMVQYRDEAQASRSRLGSEPDLLSFSPAQSPPWETGFLDTDESIWNRQSEWFQNWSKSPIFSRLMAPTCAADAPANLVHWWNRKARCDTCTSAHMENGFVRDWTAAADICQQPDIAHLHGFLASPAALGASQSLYPVFSQSRVHGFADILYPSPWSFHEKAHYDEDEDVSWEDKRNSVYWRGASSDGFAVHGSWQMFMRARFVHLASTLQKSFADAYTRGTDHVFARRQTTRTETKTSDPRTTPKGRTSSAADPLTFNVSFVGLFTRCDGRDCVAEHTTFYGSAAANPPESHDFQESWRHRHLVDLDGAAFSGRFLPFLRSASLPYRAALFRTWWEERVHPWAHYVPLDVRLEDLGGVLRHFGSEDGAPQAKEIADEGQKWARKALRREDMQVYMFRLLLEWGRLVDDKREELGFELS
ncbi:hypothetical protein F4808DRAFT_445564 [Astrocystis sublimbata]|nr:hypothetical protein F4808DRAFT_445564 [Astrocystis sublimbata]